MLNRTNDKIHKIQLSILSQYQPRPTCLNPKPYPLRPYAPMRLPQTPGLFLRRRWRIWTGVRAACDCSYLWPSMARQLPHPQWPFPFLFSFPLPARLRAAHACAVRACMCCLLPLSAARRATWAMAVHPLAALKATPHTDPSAIACAGQQDCQGGA